MWILFYFRAKLVPTIWLNLFYMPKFILWVLLTIIYIISHLCFQSSDSKPIISAATEYRRQSSHMWQQAISVCLVCFINKVLRLRHYIVSINLFYIIIFFPKHNIYRFLSYNIQEGKFVYYLGAELVPTIRMVLFLDPPKVIVWVLLAIIYIISHFIFQSSESKPGETKWRRSGEHGNSLFHFILSFTTSVTN